MHLAMQHNGAEHYMSDSSQDGVTPLIGKHKGLCSLLVDCSMHAWHEENVSHAGCGGHPRDWRL